MNQRLTQSAAVVTVDDPSPPDLRRSRLPIAPEGVPIILAFLAGAALLTLIAARAAGPLAAWPVGALAALLCLWCVWFFRDPARAIPAADGAVVSPADGVVVGLDPAPPPAELGLTDWDNSGPRVSVFMNVFNVHVNRAPAPGVVERIAYRPGRFFNASLDKASEHNERCSLVLRSGAVRLVVVQIAGLVARRIVCRVARGAALGRGERFGLIRFGSRVDVYLPPGVMPAVRVGQKVVAGETVIASLPRPAVEGS